MKSSAKKVELAPYDDLFSTEESRQDAKLEKVREIPLSELHPFKNHPFKVKDDEAMMETADSVRQYGVLVPAIARPDPEGGYELVAGHRRHRASELAEKETMPVIVRDLDDDAATIIMVDSNLQRESLLPSERAFAYRMKLEAMKRQAGRPTKENRSQLGNDFGKRSSELLAEQVGQSKNQIFRYIRLTELIPELLDMVDEKKIALNPAYELSFLKPLSLPGPATQEIQPGRTSDPRYDARHHGRGKEKRSGPGNFHLRHPAEVFSQELHAPADAGNHYQTAGGVAEEAPERPGTMKGAAYEGYFSP